MDQFNVVRMQSDNRTGDLAIVDTLEVFTDFTEALQLRDKLSTLSQQLMQIGVMFAVQYQIGIQQVRSVAGMTRKRLIDLDDRDSAKMKEYETSFFGESTEDLLSNTLKALTDGSHD